MSEAHEGCNAPNPFACEAAVAVSSTHTGVALATPAPQWPLGIGKTPVGLTSLMAPLVPLYETNATPMLPSGEECAALQSIFLSLRQDRKMPNIIVAHGIVAEGPVWQALLALDAEGFVSLTTLTLWERAILARTDAMDGETYLAHSLSSGSRKRLRAKRRTLEDVGPLRLTVHQSSDAIREAFEAFLALEDSGWKGRSGTSLRQKEQDATYVRAMLLALAETDRAFVATLSAGERTIAAGLFLRAGGEITFWKTAYDETLAKDSPGVIFDMILTEHLCAQPWFRVLDSASDESVDPAGLIWKQRRRMARVIIDLKPGSWQGRTIVAGYRLRGGLKALRNRIRPQ